MAALLRAVTVSSPSNGNGLGAVTRAEGLRRRTVFPLFSVDFGDFSTQFDKVNRNLRVCKTSDIRDIPFAIVRGAAYPNGGPDLSLDVADGENPIRVGQTSAQVSIRTMAL